MQNWFFVQSAEYGKYYIEVDVNGYGTYNIWIGMLYSDGSVGNPVDELTTSNKSSARRKYNKFIQDAETDSYGWNSHIDNLTWEFNTNTSLNSVQEYILSNPKNIKASIYIRKSGNMKKYVKASTDSITQNIIDLYRQGATLTAVGYSGFDFEDGTGTLFDVEVGYRFPDNRNDEDGIINLGDVPFEYYFDDGNAVIDFQGNFSLLFDDEAEYYDIYEKLLPRDKKYTPFKTVFYWGDIFEDILEAIQMDYDEDYDDIEESTNIRGRKKVMSASSGIRKMTQKQIKDYVRDGAAIDITNYGFDEMKDFLHSHDLDKIAVSRGIYGINGGLLQDRDTGEMYAITARNSALMMEF